MHTFLEINNAALRAVATEIDENIELISNVIHFVTTKLTIAGLLLPPLVLTAINYFIYDFGDESYVLPYPVMCVHQCFLAENFFYFHYHDRFYELQFIFV